MRRADGERDLAALLAALVVAACAAAPATQAPGGHAPVTLSGNPVPSAPSTPPPAPRSAAPTQVAAAAPLIAARGIPSAPLTIEQLASGIDGVVAAIGYSPQASGPAGVLLLGDEDALAWTLFERNPSPGLLRTVTDGPAGLRAALAEENAWRIVASADRGASWTTVATIPDAIPGDLAGGPAGYLLTGSNIVEGTGYPAAWRSFDGIAWDRPIDLPDFLNSPTAVALPDGFLLVDDGVASLEPHLALVTTSGVRLLPADELRLGSLVYLSGATIAGADLVVVRQDGAGATLWRVPADGAGTTPFTPVAGADRFLAGASVASLAAGPRGVVLLAWDRTTLARFALTSTDGLTWVRHALARNAFGGGVPNMLVATSSAFVAVGRAVTRAGGADDLWRSSDGVTWLLAPAPLGPPPAVPAGPCPPAPTTLAALAAIGTPKAAGCYGRSDLRISAYIGNCGGCGGMTVYQWVPSWLGGMFAPLYLAPDPMTSCGPAVDSVCAAWPDPAHHTVIPPEKTPVWVTGHYNDAAATTCRVVPDDGKPAGLPSIDEAIATCQRLFVVTAISVR